MRSGRKADACEDLSIGKGRAIVDEDDEADDCDGEDGCEDFVFLVLLDGGSGLALAGLDVQTGGLGHVYFLNLFL